MHPPSQAQVQASGVRGGGGGGGESDISSLVQHNFLAVFVQPRPLLGLSGIVDGLSALHGQDIEIGGVSPAVAAWQRNSHFVRGIEHHVVFPQSARAIEDAEHALLHVHVLGRGAPGQGVVLLSLAAFDQRWRAGEGYAVFGVGEALLSGLADGAVAGDVVGVGGTPAALLGLAAGVS
jgi:hypothetical protein